VTSFIPSAERSIREQPFLEVRNLSKRFSATLALDDVRLAFHSGSVHCVLGENGAGKSTLAKLLGGVHAKDHGQILINGREAEIGTVTRARQLGIAVVFQELSLADDLSVRANLVLGFEAHRHPFARLSAADERKRVRAVLDRLGLRIDTEETVGNLPVATQQLLEVAKALIRDPRMIVLDEPTAMLNEPEKRRLFGVIATLRAEGRTLAFITHHVEDVITVADHVTIMRDGRVVDSFPARGAVDAGAIIAKLGGAHVSRPHGSSGSARSPPLLTVAGLRDSTENPTEIHISRGEIVGFYGVTGCGAAQVGRSLVGLHRAPGVRWTLAGRQLILRTPAQARAAGIAYLPTGRVRNGILPTRSIRENLNVSLLARYARAGVVSARREASATHLQLTRSAVRFTSADDDITVLSGGNQQKVLLSRVMAAGCKIIILEDPTAGIDVGAKSEIQEAIRDRAADGVAVILISSDLLETIEMVDTLYTMYAGAIIHRYAPPELSDRGAIVADVVGRPAGRSGQADERVTPTDEGLK
jgi:ribose transport system ATP-binding protein